MTEKEIDKLIERLIDADPVALTTLAALSETERESLNARLHVRNTAMEEESQRNQESLRAMRSLLESNGVNVEEMEAEAGKGKIGFSPEFIESDKRHKQAFAKSVGQVLSDAPPVTIDGEQ